MKAMLKRRVNGCYARWLNIITNVRSRKKVLNVSKEAEEYAKTRFRKKFNKTMRGMRCSKISKFEAKETDLQGKYTKKNAKMKGNFDGSQNISEFRRCIIKRAHIYSTQKATGALRHHI